MPSLEDRVQALEARDEIRELTARYCHAVTRSDAATIVGLFCDDGVFEMGKTVARGRAELEKFYSSATQQPPLPFIQNHVIELAGDEGTGQCSVEIRMVRDGEAITACGYYDDRYRRVNGTWRFAARKFNPFHMVPLSKGWA